MSRRRSSRRQLPRRARAFTLIEILVVIAIILLASLVALPVLSGLSGRQVSDGAGILTGALAGVRDSAIRQNEPRGLRLMPDPTLTIPALGQVGAGTLQLAFNRLVPIEPAADYSSGKVSIGPQIPPGYSMPGFPPAHPITGSATYPFPDSTIPAKVLMIEESPFAGGFVVGGPSGTAIVPNEPANWFWNIRVGDKLKLGDTGRAYTVVGPCTINPLAPIAANRGNPELFVNVGPPGTPSPLLRTYWNQATKQALPAGSVPAPEFLFLVNGEDDDSDGWIDPGWDGYDEPYPAGTANVIDDIGEWVETEEWKGSLASNVMKDSDISGGSPSFSWISNSFANGTHDVAYSIERRPVPSPGAREVALPAGVVIDATSGLSGQTQERSRLPIQLNSLTVDIMLNPNGLYIPTTIYSTPTSAPSIPFLHFWLTDRNDVFPLGSVWGTNVSGSPSPNPNAAASPPQTYQLPMTTDAGGGYPPTSGAVSNPPILKNERRLVTFFCQSGMVVTNTIDTIPAVPPLPGEGFNTGDVNQPFYKAQLGQREVK